MSSDRSREFWKSVEDYIKKIAESLDYRLFEKNFACKYLANLSEEERKAKHTQLHAEFCARARKSAAEIIEKYGVQDALDVLQKLGDEASGGRAWRPTGDPKLDCLPYQIDQQQKYIQWLETQLENE